MKTDKKELQNMQPIDKKLYYDPNDSGLGFAVCCIVPQLLAVIIYLILGAFGASGGLGVKIVSCTIGPICYFSYFCIINKEKNIDWKNASGIKFTMKWWHPLLAIGLGLVCLFGLNYFIALVDKGLELIGYTASGSIGIPMDNFGWFVLNVLLLAVLPAICEELIFRGIIFNGMREMGEVSAVFFSSFLFALFHGNASQTVYQFILGIVLCYIFIITKNLLCSMILHFTNNFVVLLINYISRNKPASAIEFNATFIVFAILGAIATGIVVWLVVWLFTKYQKQDKNDIQISQEKLLERKVRGQVFANKLLWIGMIFALTIWIADFIY